MSVVRRADQRQKPLVFMHIGKVGGYSISQELFSRFPIAIVATLRRLQPNVQIMFSVSPVPLFSSFEYPSAIVADCVSKSTLRTSIDVLLKRRLEGVHYWPAFEIVRWLGAYTGPMFGEEDGTTRHVSGRVVDAIMDAFFSVHGSDAAVVPGRMTA